MLELLVLLGLAFSAANAWLLRRVLRQTPDRSRLAECRERLARSEADRAVVNQLVLDLRRMSEEKDREILRRDELIREMRHDLKDMEWPLANQKQIIAQLTAKLEEIRAVGRKNDGRDP